VTVLVINAGSTSMKVAVVDGDAVVWSREVDDLEAEFAALATADVVAVGHRVVHGGHRHRDTVLVDNGVLDAIRAAMAFAPSHNAAALAAIATARAALPALPQVAVFDTSFHRTIPEAARTYGGPRRWVEDGLVRFGFHGISHQWASERAAAVLGRPAAALELVTCHLGGGCSLAAVRHGESVDTTMGLTALDGLVMGTRSGAVDPGLLLHLLRTGMTVDALDDELEHHAGLLGLSGVSEDLRDVLAARDRGDAAAALAIAVFVHRVATGVGQMLASLETPAALVFTGGIGEHSAEVRRRVVERLPWLGVALDDAANAAAAGGERDISDGGATVRTLVIPAHEDIAIGREVTRLLAGNHE
jgi:acetate kinase